MLATRSPGVAPPLQQMLQSGYRLPTRPLFLENLVTLLGPVAGVFATGIKICDRLQVFSCHVQILSQKFCGVSSGATAFAVCPWSFPPSHFFLIILGKCALRKHRRQMNCFTTPWHLGVKGHMISTGACPFKLPLSSCTFLATKAFLLAMEGIFIEVPDGRPLEYRKSCFGFLGWTLRQWSNRTCQSLLFWPYNAASQCLHF